MLFVNLTTHTVTVMAADGGVTARWLPSGTVARLVELTEPSSSLASAHGPIPTVSMRYSPEVEGLPEPQAGVVHVVSRVTATAVERDDLLFPADEVRDDRGHIIGWRALGRFVPLPSSYPDDEGCWSPGPA